MTDRELVDESFQLLQEQMNKFQRLVQDALDGCRPNRCECLLTNCRHRQVLLQTVLHSVRVLEDTRKAFKSRQLETLRKDLMQILADETKALPSTQRQ